MVFFVCGAYALERWLGLSLSQRSTAAAAASPVVDVFILSPQRRRRRRRRKRRRRRRRNDDVRAPYMLREIETRTFLICCSARRASVQLVRVNRSDSVVVVADDDLLYGGLFL